MGLINSTPAKDFYMNVIWSLQNSPNLVLVEFAPFLVFFIMLFSLSRFLPGRPWIILVALLGLLYGVITEKWITDIKPTLLKDKYTDMSRGATIIDFSYMSKEVSVKAVLIGSLEVAFVAILETLISARIADNLTGTRFNQSKEVLGMALGNMLSGLLGGVPCTGVLVRTGVNVASGATDKMSQFINAISVLIIVMLLLPMFSYIPMPVIASILISSAIRLVPFTIMTQLAKEDAPELFILIFTTTICIFGDGALGLLSGGFVALMRNAASNNYGYLSFSTKGDSLQVDITGQLSFVNALDIEIKVVDKIRETKLSFVIINLSDLKYIDIDGIDCLKNIHKLKKSCTFGFAKMSGNSVLDSSEFVNKSGDFYETIEEAITKTLEKGPSPD
jgi:MFS superfamily sulfate permease-like transporter